MGKVITVMNMKGGVGKTTVTMNIGGAIATYNLLNGPLQDPKKGTNVLLIDYDPQFNLTQAYIKPAVYFDLEKKRKTTLSILQDNEVDLDPFQLQVPGNHTPPKLSDIVFTFRKFHNGSVLDIIPSTLDLMYVALGQANVNTKPIEERFEKFIEECKKTYDVIFIDCHPAGSLFTKTALRNSDHVLIPVIPQKYAVRGIGLMMQFIKSKTLIKNAPTAHILFNHTARSGKSDQELEIREHKEYGDLCLGETLKKFKAFSEPEEGKNFVWTSSKAYSTEALGNLLKVSRELLGRIKD
ncbi:hypothetical protein A7981_04390 [Methylovorus sp. MM2]|uniref:ParA family protein n=1 Tax=Methylovorus sp. MM2 TaxID=1848038 RepID=UPI0007E27462|nr:ParA family protein [Methylovorus sp. MM2]OAM52697.1 hypothetical protein A7981_04390 [Methylovorus sp. MM2]